MILSSKKFLLLCLIIFNFNSLLSRDFITVWDLSKPGRNQNELTFGVQALGTVHYTWQTIPSGASGSGSIQIGAFYECTIPGLPTNSMLELVSKQIYNVFLHFIIQTIKMMLKD